METLIVCIGIYLTLGFLVGIILFVNLEWNGSWRMLFKPVNKKNTYIVWATIILLGPGCWAILVILSISVCIIGPIINAVVDLNDPREGK